MSRTEWPHHFRRRNPAPRDVVPLPLARVAAPVDRAPAPQAPETPMQMFSNDMLWRVARDAVAELNRRGCLPHNAWPGPRVTEADVITWLGDETHDAMMRHANRTIALSIAPSAQDAERDAP